MATSTIPYTFDNMRANVSITASTLNDFIVQACQYGNTRITSYAGTIQYGVTWNNNWAGFMTLRRTGGNCVFEIVTATGLVYTGLYNGSTDAISCYLSGAPITYSTTDLTAGSSTLSTNELYLVYE